MHNTRISTRTSHSRFALAPERNTGKKKRAPEEEEGA